MSQDEQFPQIDEARPPQANGMSNHGKFIQHFCCVPEATWGCRNCGTKFCFKHGPKIWVDPTELGLGCLLSKAFVMREVSGGSYRHLHASPWDLTGNSSRPCVRQTTTSRGVGQHFCVPGADALLMPTASLTRWRARSWSIWRRGGAERHE